LTSLKVDPIYDGVRGDPRFQRLLQRMGLAEILEEIAGD